MLSHEKEINTSYGRFILDANADAKMALHLEGARYPQQDALELIQAFGVKSVVDIGAHIGTVTVPLARAGVQVIAFEPNSTTFDYLSRNCVLNQVTPDLRNKGLGKNPGKARTAPHGVGNAGSHSLALASGGDIEISTLDTEVATTDFIKIDVEGMELPVLEGGQALLKHMHPSIYFEVNLRALRRHQTSLQALSKFLTQAGYRLYFLENKRLYQVPSVSVSALFIAPRSFLFGSRSAPFDLLAVHSSVIVPYPIVASLKSFVFLLGRYITRQYARFARP